MKSPKIEEILITSLKDEDPNVRLNAADALADLSLPRRSNP